MSKNSVRHAVVAVIVVRRKIDDTTRCPIKGGNVHPGVGPAILRMEDFGPHPHKTVRPERLLRNDERVVWFCRKFSCVADVS
jgi:hypothetical protein